MHPVRRHFAPQYNIDPAEQHTADIGWLGHVVHRKSGQDLHQYHRIESSIGCTGQRVPEKRCMGRFQQHIVQGDIDSLTVEMPLPDAREQAVTFVDNEAIDAQDKRCTEEECCQEMDISDPVHRHGRIRRFNPQYGNWLGDKQARNEQGDDCQHHDPMENPQERTEQIVDFSLFFFHSTYYSFLSSPINRH